MAPSDPPQKPSPLARTVQPIVGPALTQSALMVPSAEYHPGQSTEHDSSVSLTALFQALNRRWPLALGVALAGAALTVAVLLVVMPAKFTAAARLKVDSSPAPSLFGHFQQRTEPAVWKGNQEAIIKSVQVLNEALNSDKVKDLEVAQGSTDWLERAVKVDFLLGPEIMRISLSGDQQDEVAPLVNALVDAYLSYVDQEEDVRRKKLLKELKGKQRMLRTQLDAKEAEMQKLRIEHGLEDPKTAERRYHSADLELQRAKKDYDEIRSDLTKKRREKALHQARLKTLDSEPVSPFAVDKYFQQSPFLQEHFKSMADVSKRIADTRRTAVEERQKELLADLLRERDFLLKAYESACQDLRPEIEKKIRAETRESLIAQIELLTIQIDGLGGQEKDQSLTVKDLEQRVQRLLPDSGPPEVKKLVLDIKQLDLQLADANKMVGSLEMEPMPATRIIRLQEATRPGGKDYSRQLKYGAVGGFGMFGLLLFGVAYWECRARRVYAVNEVTRGLGMSVLGTLPPLPRRVRGRLTTTHSERERSWQSLMTESIDAVRTLLLHAARTDALQVVMVTSAGDGEGKTSLASQLAASLARAWRRTLLVDGDLRNPAAHKLFDVPQEPGFSEVLRGDSAISDVIRPTPLSRLWLMPAGRWDSHALQALAQQEVHKLFGELKESYDFIVVDSCPVLPVTDSLLLGQHVDAVIFSILRDVSRMPAVQAAQKRLHALGIRTFGAVVLGADAELSSSTYQYPGQLVS